MEKHYRHLTTQDRIQLYEHLFSGEPIDEIANHLGFHKATIYRELARNSNRHGYRPDWAAQQYLARKFRHENKLDKNPELKEFIIARLKERWSPQQISGRLKKSAGQCNISHETIYAYIYSESGKAQKLYQLLQKKRRFRYPRIRRKRQKPALEAEKIGIIQRGEEINHRKTFGHWEGGLLMFTKHNPHLITLRERKSRYLVAIKNNSRKPQETASILVKYMKKNLGDTMHSLTLDNDNAFAHHSTIANALGASVYFCEPYKSYQKGAIENANRLLRQYLPKKASIEKYTQQDIEMIVDKFNNQPMRCLDYCTPKEVFYEHRGALNPQSEIRT
jgi:IS30 family transposase